MISQRSDQPAAPIEVLIRQFICIGIDREKRIKRCRPEADPFDCFDGFRKPCADLTHRCDTCPVDSDRAVHTALSGVAVGVGVVWCSLIVRGQQIFHILYGYFPFRYERPGNVVALR